MSFAEIARELNISRVYARSRVKALVEDGIIEKFTAVTNPEKLGKMVSTFVDLKVAPEHIEKIAAELSSLPEVVSLYIMSDLQSLHIHTLTDSHDVFSDFVHQYLFGRPEIISVQSHTLLKRIKNRRGGARL